MRITKHSPHTFSGNLDNGFIHVYRSKSSVSKKNILRGQCYIPFLIDGTRRLEQCLSIERIMGMSKRPVVVHLDSYQEVATAILRQVGQPEHVFFIQLLRLIGTVVTIDHGLNRFSWLIADIPIPTLVIVMLFDAEFCT